MVPLTQHRGGPPATAIGMVQPQKSPLVIVWPQPNSWRLPRRSAGCSDGAAKLCWELPVNPEIMRTMRFHTSKFGQTCLEDHLCAEPMQLCKMHSVTWIGSCRLTPGEVAFRFLVVPTFLLVVAIQKQLSCVQLCAPWTVAHQAPLSSKFLLGESSSLGTS